MPTEYENDYPMNDKEKNNAIQEWVKKQMAWNQDQAKNYQSDIKDYFLAKNEILVELHNYIERLNQK